MNRFIFIASCTNVSMFLSRRGLDGYRVNSIYSMISACKQVRLNRRFNLNMLPVIYESGSCFDVESDIFWSFIVWSCNLWTIYSERVPYNFYSRPPPCQYWFFTYSVIILCSECVVGSRRDPLFAVVESPFDSRSFSLIWCVNHANLWPRILLFGLANVMRLSLSAVENFRRCC